MDYRSPEAAPLLPGPGGRQQKDATSKRSKLFTVCPFILGNEFCERLAYYGLATNLVTYLTHIMGVDAAAAAVQVMVFEGTCYVTPLLGAYLADSHWGRYKTILVFSSIYLCGCVLLTATSGVPGLTPGPTDDPTWVQSAALVGALGVIALGTGGIKPNVSAFGADQFDEKDPQDKREKESFFNWFYLAINIGSLIACTCIVYVQDTISWTVGFAIPAAAMGAAVLLFLAGSRHYRHVAPTESPMARVVKVVTAALHNRWRNKRSKAAIRGARREQRGALSSSQAHAQPGSPDLYQQQQQQQQQPWQLPGGGFPGGGSPGGGGGAPGGGRPPLPGGSRGSSSPMPIPGSSSGGGGVSSSSNGAGGGAFPLGSSVGAASSVRVGSFSWLEDAITEWQQASSNRRLEQQQQEQQQQQRQQGQGQGQVQVQVQGQGPQQRLQGPQQRLQPQGPAPRHAPGSSRLGGGSGGGAGVLAPSPSGGVGGYSPQQVQEVKLVLRLLPVFATTMMYWCVYAMMGTFFIQQGSLMDNRVPLPALFAGSSSSGSNRHSGGGGGSGSGGDGPALYIPSATMALFNTGAIILLVPLYDRLIEPAIKGAGLRWTLLRRIGWGMVVAVLAMFYAACVEMWRLDIYRAMQGGGGDDSAPTATVVTSSSLPGGYGPTVVPLSILWQAPAYMLVGASEVLASIAQLEFFYDQAPDVMRSCSMALQLLSTALGSYLGGGLVAAVAAATSASGSPWLPKDLNTGHLDYFLWLCGALMAANTLLFVVVANGYEYKTVEHVVLVQVPDEQEEEVEAALPDTGLPPRMPPPPQRRAGAAIAINTSAARRSQYHYAAQEGPEEEGELYSRSLAFVPTSPALPAPFR